MSSRPHIAIVCPSCGGGGAVGSVAMRQAIELARQFRVTIVSNSFPEVDPQWSVRVVQINPARFDYLRRFCHVPNEYAFIRSATRAIERIHQVDPIAGVVVHGHALGAITGRKMKRRYEVPFMLVTHADVFDRPEGTYDRRLALFYRILTPIAYREANAVFAVSPHLAVLARARGAAAHSVRVIPNGIDPAEIGMGQRNEREADSSETSPLLILYVGRLAIEKGIDVLIDAAEQLARMKVAFSLDVAGSGRMADQLQEKAAASGLEGIVRFVGTVPRRELGRYYAAADILCVPSRSEPFGLVVLEALAAGVPVVGSDIGGISFIIEPGVNGILVPPGSAEALAEAIRDLAMNRKRLKELRRQARESVLKRFSWETIGTELIRGVSEVIGGVRQS